ncbi:(3S)-malyl-CoA thioesterase [Rhodobacteraceae bacterium MBR-64]|jgi:(3S)-malyl-CoA thioesterase
MDLTARPWRSVLYIPGSKPRALEKARGLACDAIIFDLEDAVSPSEKAAARDTLAGALREGGFGARARIVRINALDTEWGAGDAAALSGLEVEGVLLPKVDGPAQLDALAALVPDAALWAMMESPLGILGAGDIAAHPRLAGLVLGTNDLAKDLGCDAGGGRAALQVALQTALLAARAHGRICVDGVYNAFRDDDGLRAECAQGVALGFDGKTLIHPGQIEIANAAFAPQPDAIDLAQRQIAAFDEAAARGEGVAVVDGKIVENLHIVTAKRLLAKARAIARLEAGA